MRLLITGGTGSLGQALTRHWLQRPDLERLAIYSRDEQKQGAMSMALNDPRLRWFIGDVRDEDRMTTAMSGVDTVIHTAAMKVVSACEYNPFECVKTNIHGTENVVQAAIRAKVKDVLLVSSDKAVNPVNLYGASKLAAEKIVMAAPRWVRGSGPRFHVIRYGNVIGSRGSVVEAWSRKNPPLHTITMTDAGATRFWLTLQQACGWVDMALGMPTGSLLIPKLPTADMATVANAIAPDAAWSLIGLQQGEKLHESLLSADEARTARDYGGYFVLGNLPEGGQQVEADLGYRSDNPFDKMTVERFRLMAR